MFNVKISLVFVFAFLIIPLPLGGFSQEIKIGKSIPRADAVEKVTGRVLYGTDVKLTGIL